MEIWADQACTTKPERKTYYPDDKLYLKFNKDVPQDRQFLYEYEEVQMYWLDVVYIEAEEDQRAVRQANIPRFGSGEQYTEQHFKAGDIVEIEFSDTDGVTFPPGYPFGYNFE